MTGQHFAVKSRLLAVNSRTYFAMCTLNAKKMVSIVRWKFLAVGPK